MHDTEKHFYLHKISFRRIRLNFRLSLMRQLMEVRRKVFEVYSIPFYISSLTLYVVGALACRILLIQTIEKNIKKKKEEEFPPDRQMKMLLSFNDLHFTIYSNGFCVR